MQINIKADVSQALRENEKNKRRVIQAAVRSLNRTADQVRSAGTKSIAEELGVKQKVVRDGLRVIRAKNSTLTAIVVASGKPLGLISFKARQTAAGVTAVIGGKRQLFKGAFIGIMPGGHRGVFRRRTNKRLPIREMYGGSIPSTMAGRVIYTALERVVDVRWPINFAADLRYYLSRS
jgi:hypothetical protein